MVTQFRYSIFLNKIVVTLLRFCIFFNSIFISGRWMDNNQKAEKIETQLLLNGLPFPAEITSRAARSL